MRPIRIGISGLNNVGKTYLATRLCEAVSRTVPAKLYHDEFRSVGGTSMEDNYLILFSQLANEVSGEAEINIYDRTLVDNLCFLRVREGKSDHVYRSLAPCIASRVKQFDLIIDIRNASTADVKATKLVSAAQRKVVRRSLDEFFSTYGIRKLDVTIEEEDPRGKLDEVAAQLAGQIMDIYRMRGIGRA